MVADIGRIAILTPDAGDVDRYDDWREQADRFDALLPEVTIDYPPWVAADLDRYALVLPLMAWGYHRQSVRWIAALERWEASAVRLANSLAIVRANTDKRYLLNLAARGVAVVPTLYTAALTRDDLAGARRAFACATLVVKPPISAGSQDTYRLEGDAPAGMLGRAMLIQPLMPAIVEGELSLFFAGGVLAHAIVKRPAEGDFRVQPQFGGVNVAIVPPAPALALAAAALAATGGDILYARVDMVGDNANGWALMEIELIEPYLYLDRAADGGTAFAQAVRARL